MGLDSGVESGRRARLRLRLGWRAGTADSLSIGGRQYNSGSFSKVPRVPEVHRRTVDVQQAGDSYRCGPGEREQDTRSPRPTAWRDECINRVRGATE